MIHPNELRTGNAFIDICGSYSTFNYEWQKHYFDQGMTDVFDFINPIPLTHEILEKFGFIKYSEREFYLNGTATTLLRLIKSGLGWNISYYHIINLKFVHQLQNLCFDLTGKELIFTPHEKTTVRGYC